MANVIVLTILLLLVVNIGETEAESLKIRLDIDNCLQSSYYIDLNKTCNDVHDEKVACLKEIDPENDFDTKELENVIKYEEGRLGSCPYLKELEICLDHEITDCMHAFRNYLLFRSNYACDEVKRSKNCLIQFNDTCDREAITREMGSLDRVWAQCKSGHWDRGPCFPENMYICTKGVLFVDYQPDLENISYSCEKPDVDRVKSCLAAKKSKCTTPDQQEEADKILYEVDQKCKSSE